MEIIGKIAILYLAVFILSRSIEELVDRYRFNGRTPYIISIPMFFLGIYLIYLAVW